VFGFSAREKAAKAALDWLAPVVLSIKHQNLGPAVWRDPLVLGYLNIYIATVLNQYIPAVKRSPDELLQMWRLVFQQIDPAVAPDMVKQSTALAAAKDKDFDAGMAAGEKVIRATLGAPLPDGDRDVVVAKKMANDDPLGEGLATYKERLVGALVMVVLFSKIADRFDIEWEPGGL
jgi:hypothetical protein